jgi:SsrA-binding protein
MAKKKKERAPASLLNRRAEHEYYFIEKFEAGIILMGSEVKALREGNANLTDAFCLFKDGELFIKNLHISEYQKSGAFNIFDSKRQRKLLLKAREIKKLQRAMAEKGKTIVPYRIYFNERGIAKAEICLAAGKKTYDKRETLKLKDQKRELDSIKKQLER